MITFKKCCGVVGTALVFGFMALWIGFWSFGTIAFDIAMTRSAARQLLALGYPTTDGVITASRVEIEPDSEGNSYTPAVEYRYAVARQEHLGRRLQHQSVSFGSQFAKNVAARYPVGSRVKVYYNPRDPAEALLVPGLDAGYALTALFMLPFNLVMFGCWFAALEFCRGGRGRLPWVVSTSTSPAGQMLRLYPCTPVQATAGVVLAASFLGVFIAAFGSMVLPLGLLVGLVWAAVIGGSVWIWRRQQQRARLLTIDDFRGQLSFARVQSRRPERLIPLAELQAIHLRKKTKRDSDGDETHTWSVALVQCEKSGRVRRLCLAAHWTEQLAQHLADWLADRLKLPLAQGRA